MRRRACGSAVCVLVAAGVWTPAAPATVVSHTVAGSPARAKRVKAFWTRRRMMKAVELPVMQRPVASPAEPSPSDSARSPAGQPGAVPPLAPKDYADGSAAAKRTHMAQLIPDPQDYPYRTQGKLFFQAQDGAGRWGAYLCSATVVNTPTQRVIFTAGHCEYDYGWSRKVVFVPGYEDGHRPFGSFTATRLYAPSAWIKYGNDSFDFSAAVLGGTRRVAAVVGGRGIMWNQPRQESFVSYGYPAAFPYDGEELWSCPSQLGGLDRSTNSPQTQWINCDMTGGSSGGGWIIQGTSLNSVNSYGYIGVPNRMYGPYFGNAAARLYSTVKYQAP